MKTRECWRLQSVLTSYVDDEVTAGERAEVENHLQRCGLCRRRANRQAAVRQRLRRWSTQMRGEGVSVTWPAQAESTGRDRTRTLRRVGVLSSASAALIVAFTAGSFWRGGGNVALAASGQITDSRCATGHTHNAAALKDMNGRDCVQRCVEMGARYVFVSQGVVYPIRNQDHADLGELAGQRVLIEGEVRQNLLTVARVRRSAARGSDDGSRLLAAVGWNR